MKVAVVIAKFPSGWRTLALGEQTAELRGAFKEVKVAGFFVDKDEVAEVVVYLDTAGNIMRKFLRTPEAVEKIEQANAQSEDETAAVLKRLEEFKALSDGRAAAQQIAGKAVALVASEISALAATPSPTPVAPSLAPATTPVEPAQPITPPAPDSAPDPSGEAPVTEEEIAEDDPAARFGGTPAATPRGSKKSK